MQEIKDLIIGIGALIIAFGCSILFWVPLVLYAITWWLN